MTILQSVFSSTRLLPRQPAASAIQTTKNTVHSTLPLAGAKEDWAAPFGSRPPFRPCLEDKESCQGHHRPGALKRIDQSQCRLLFLRERDILRERFNERDERNKSSDAEGRESCGKARREENKVIKRYNRAIDKLSCLTQKEWESPKAYGRRAMEL